jgi:hypothetical protein
MGEGRTYSADDIIVVGEVGFAALAAVDAAAVEVRVVSEAHDGGVGVGVVWLPGESGTGFWLVVHREERGCFPLIWPSRKVRKRSDVLPLPGGF